MRRRTSNAPSDSRNLAALLSSALVALAAFTSPLRAQQPAAKPLSLAAIIDAMQAREKLAASVSLRWTRTDHYRAGALLAKASTWTFSCELLLKGNSTRYSGKIINHARGNISLIDYTTSFEGNESRRVLGLKPPYGSIHRVKETPSYHFESPQHLAPLLLFLRPLVEPYSGTFKRRTWKLLEERRRIDGHECVTVDDGHTRAYLDCDRDFVPVTFERYTENRAVWYSGSLEYYGKQGALRWVPRTFLLKLHSSAPSTADETRGDGVQTEIGVLLKDSDFRLDFGPGTVVWDAGTEERYRVRDDGSKESAERPHRAKPVRKEQAR
jgi:hypothetical protein